MKTRTRFESSHSVHYHFGGSFHGTLTAPTYEEMLAKIKAFAYDHSLNAELITFSPIKQIIETVEEKGFYFRYGGTGTGHASYIRKHIMPWYKRLMGKKKS